MRRFNAFKNLEWLFLYAHVFLFALPSLALDRSAFTFTRYELQVRVEPQAQGLEVHGRITLRNDSTAPQKFIALQVSSTLAWQAIELEGKPLLFLSQPYTTDIDHTGSVSEAIVTLPREIAPKGGVELEVAYDGTIPADSTRLTRIGVSTPFANRSDWDQISETFSAVRGVGYVCWYPVAMEAASISSGSDLFATLAEWKSRNATAVMQLSLAAVSDKIVFANGRLTAQKARREGEASLQEREYEFSPLGLIPPTFAIGDYIVATRPEATVMHLAGHEAAAQEYLLAAQKLTPIVSEWLGAPRERLTVMELPEGYTRFDSGAILFAPLGPPDRTTAELAVVHPLAHACFQSSRLWMEEGLAHFMEALVREQQAGRKAAVEFMGQYRPAIVEAEEISHPRPASPSGKDAGGAVHSRAGQQAASSPPAGDPLTRTTDEIYFRWKAMYVWWMLRDIAGDEALQRALNHYRSADDKEPAYLQRLIEAQTKHSLEWFFDDWVYRDRGLPDFRVVSVYSQPALPEGVSITVKVRNDGDAGAETPILIPQPHGEAVQRALVRAHEEGATRITVPSNPVEVLVNDGSVPESNTNNHRVELKNSVPIS